MLYCILFYFVSSSMQKQYEMDMVKGPLGNDECQKSSLHHIVDFD